MDGEFTLWIPSFCKSAGTLVALGANKLIMDTFSELGPLDVQLLKQDEIGTRKSGLLSGSTFQALQNESFNIFEHLMLEIKKRSYDQISFKLASEISSKITSDLLSEVYKQISPDVVGSDYRDLQVAFEYGVRLIKYGKNAEKDSVRSLVEEYPSHDFIIDNDEARSLFLKVEEPQKCLYKIVGFFDDFMYDESLSGVVLSIEKVRKNKEETDAKSDIENERSSESPSKPVGMDGDRTADRGSDQQKAGGDESSSNSNDAAETPSDGYKNEKGLAV